MAFGFVIERFGLFLQIAGREEIKVFQRHISFFIGIAFILLATFVAAYSIKQHLRIIKSLRPVEIPPEYNVRLGMYTNAIIGVLGIILCFYLLREFV